MKIIDMKVAVIGQNPVVRIITDEYKFHLTWKKAIWLEFILKKAKSLHWQNLFYLKMKLKIKQKDMLFKQNESL